MKHSYLAIVLLPLLALDVAAQSQKQLTGLTRFNPSLRRQTLNCQMQTQCAIPGMPVTINAFAGGTAWDPVGSGAWVTNGRFLAKVDDNCNVQCAPIQIPSLSSVTTFITGLEVNDIFNQLWMSDSDGRIHRFTNSCPPQFLGACTSVLQPTPAPNQRVTTAIAIDEGIGLVFIAYTNMNTGVSKIAVNDLSDPCVTFEIIDAPACLGTFGPITGLACDWGEQRLYATNGATTADMNYSWNGSNLLVVSTNCCPGVAVLDPMVGLTIRPGSATTIGQSCNNGACPNCPMFHRLGNDPVVGNLDFRLMITGAPASSFTFCMIGDDPCSAPGILIPPLCGPVLVGNYIGYLGPNLIPSSSTSICNNLSTFNLPIPAVPALVGDVYSSQVVNLCLNPTGSGFAMSNCLSWELQGI